MLDFNTKLKVLVYLFPLCHVFFYSSTIVQDDPKNTNNKKQRDLRIRILCTQLAKDSGATDQTTANKLQEAVLTILEQKDKKVTTWLQTIADPQTDYKTLLNAKVVLFFLFSFCTFLFLASRPNFLVSSNLPSMMLVN